MQLDGEELEQKIDFLIGNLGLHDMKGMGQLMSTLNSETGGNFDKNAAAAYAKKLLS